MFMNGEEPPIPAVALLAEGVARRAWIEILVRPRCCSASWVALLAEGVDRNVTDHRDEMGKAVSPSSRRAWIEISIRIPV